MNEIAAIVIYVVLAVMTVFQVCLIAGAPWGNFAWGGMHRVLPTRLRIGSVISILLYVLCALLVLDKAGLVAIFSNEAISSVGTWIFASYFMLGIPMNAISRSKKERLVMTPVVLIVAIASLIIALS